MKNRGGREVAAAGLRVVWMLSPTSAKLSPIQQPVEASDHRARRHENYQDILRITQKFKNTS